MSSASTAPEEIAKELLSRCLDLPVEDCEGAHLRRTPEWDSFAHVELVVEIEERYGLGLDQEQIDALTSYDSLVVLLRSLATPT
jgi:acyl carrier protein